MLQTEKDEREAWKVAPLADLVRHLVGTCHLVCRQDLALLETRLELAVLEAGDAEPALLEVRDLAGRFCLGMRAHLVMEERHLFPAILAKASGQNPGGDLEALQTLLEGDHESEAALLRTLRNLTQPLAEQAPGTPAAGLYDAVMAIAGRLQKHFYLEAQILLPRTQQLG